MKKNVWIGFMLGLTVSAALAQNNTESGMIRRQLQEANQSFQKAVEQHRVIIDSLNKRLETLERQSGVAAPPAELLKPPPPATASPTAAPVARVWSPADPIPVARAGSAYMNISFDTLVDAGWSTATRPGDELNLGDHDPLRRGFTLPNAEIALDGAVDPYLKGFASIVLKLDQDNETHIELEEAFLQSASLPANLQVKAGQFLGAFGRQNAQHAHAWAFVDQPLILNRAFGPDGLRNVGAQVAWLMPLPFYSELFLGLLNGQGETAFSFRNPGEDEGDGGRVHGRATVERELRGLQDFLWVPRWATSFELSRNQTLVAGLSAALGPNSTGPRESTQIYGVDLYWKWKSDRARGGWPFVSWQAEALWRRFDAGADAGAMLATERLDDYGFYSQLLWGFRHRWVAGLRGEHALGNDGAFDTEDVFRGKRTRVSPNLTWYLTEFSKLRLQYNYDRGTRFGQEHSVWLQVEFLLGAHGAHKF